MINRVEFGSLNRSEDSPILIKEKIGADGKPSVKIYQRKDIDSIENFKDRIKTMVKYSVEDFFIANKNFQPLLEKIGFNKINYLKTDNIENPSNFLQSIKSGARIGAVTKENEIKLKNILNDSGFDGDYQYNFYKGNYKNEDFFTDLKAFVNTDNGFNAEDWLSVGEIENYFMNDSILSADKLKKYVGQINKIKTKIDENFSPRIKLSDSQSPTDTTSHITDSPKGSSSILQELKNEIDSKLEEIAIRITTNSNQPKNETLRKSLLFTLSEIQRKGKIEANLATETRGAIDIIFSTGWWISKEKRQQSLEKVQTVFQDFKQSLPEALRDAIYPS
jgi:hypothetical protein